MGLGVVRESGAVAKFEDPRISKLRQIIKEQSLLTGTFTLSSGRESNYLFQLRQTTLHPGGIALIGELVVEFMGAHGLRCIAGLELGAVPIVSAAAQASFGRYPIGAFFVRKRAKAHGAQERVDGYIKGYGEFLVVDDVTTTGNSMLDAIEAIRDEGYPIRVTKALSIVDREEGAAANLASHGIDLFSLIKRSDFGL